jgi:CMP-N,N'-diacetyllegionaminic acid synthase
MNLLITICARGGSKGIPGKNVKIIDGKPLIAFTINAAFEFGKHFNADIRLSTDCQKIKEVARSFGLETDYTRPKELSSDTAGKVDVIKDLLAYEESKTGNIYNYILDLDVTSPLRTQEDLHAAFSQLIRDKNALNIFSVNYAARNPYFNMVEKNSNGYVQLVKSAGNIKSRQSAPPVFDMNASFYFYRRDFFMGEFQTTITDRSLAYVMEHVCFDLDEFHDFVVMDFMMSNNKFNFKF